MAEEPTTRDMLTIIMERTNENNRTLRGANGNEGLVSIVSRLSVKVEAIECLVAEIKADIKALKVDETKNESNHAVFTERLDQRIDFKSLVKEWFVPIALTLITALLLSRIIGG